MRVKLLKKFISGRLDQIMGGCGAKLQVWTKEDMN